jgi:uncharacterized protein (DUF2344 family)
MLKVFQRSFARADIEIQHSQGFNPHPKLSLPLPRPVGVESDDELLCVQVNGGLNESQVIDRLSKQLPEGCDILSVTFAQTNESIQPSAVTYIIPVQQEYLDDELRGRIEQLLESESLVIERRKSMKRRRSSLVARRSVHESRGTIDEIRVNVRPFIKKIEIQGDSNVVIECNVSPAGSIRIDEILKLLEINTDNLAAPIRRACVQWQEPEDRIQN